MPWLEICEWVIWRNLCISNSDTVFSCFAPFLMWFLIFFLFFFFSALKSAKYLFEFGLELQAQLMCARSHMLQKRAAKLFVHVFFFESLWQPGNSNDSISARDVEWSGRERRQAKRQRSGLARARSERKYESFIIIILVDGSMGIYCVVASAAAAVHTFCLYVQFNFTWFTNV